MNTVIQGEVARPHEMRTEYHVPDAERYGGAHFPFDIAFTGQWEFCLPERFQFAADPPRDGRVRTWHVDPIHPEGEWVAEVTEIRHNPGGNGVTEVGEVGKKRINAAAHVLGMTNKGAIVVQAVPSDTRMGPYATFRARFLNGAGGWFYCYSGVHLRPVPYPRGAAIPERDAGWIIGMRRHLVSAGIVPPMGRHSLDHYVKIEENRIQRWGERMVRGDMDRASFERGREETLDLIARMRKAWERQYGELAAPIEDGPVIAQPDVEADGAAIVLDDLASPTGEAPSPSQRRKR